MGKRFIRFRVWDKKIKKYVDIDNPKIGMLLWDYQIYMSTGCDASDNPIWEWENIERYRYVFEQLTNLLDKNGKDIYEGDICRVNGEYRQVIYNEEKAAFMWKILSDESSSDYRKLKGEMRYMNEYGDYSEKTEIIGNMNKENETANNN